MLALHKKMIVSGVVIVLAGVLISSILPVLAMWSFDSGFGSSPLGSAPLAFLNSLIQSALIPFGAVLAAIGVAKHMTRADAAD